jgi:diadenylate cyclase
MKYILVDIPTVLSKANQGLATLEKYRDHLDRIASRLSEQERQGAVMLHDALTVLQRAELVTRMATEVERYIVELGTEGRLIEMQLEETVMGVMSDRAALVRDYIAVDGEVELESALSELAALPYRELLDFGRLAEVLGYDRKANTHDVAVVPRGYRALAQIPRLPRLVAQKLVMRFGDLEGIIGASDAELAAVDGVGQARAEEVRAGLARIWEAGFVDRYTST